MGVQSSSLDGVILRAESRVGKIGVSGRYHRLPKRLEDDYKTSVKVLGSGYNGKVRMAESKVNGGKYAVKAFKLHGVSRSKKEELENEAEIFLSLDHPHIVRLVDVYESEEHLNLVMECATGGELFKRVRQKRRFSEGDAAMAAWQMLLAVSYIHHHHVVHRDIKLENFLYDSEDSDHLKLIDFGFSKIWKKNTKMEMSCGTLPYVAPEVLNHSYTSRCDLWSLGVTIFVVLFGHMPFFGSEETQIEAIRAGKYHKKDSFFKASKQAQDFVKNLMVVDPNVRLTAEQALKHAWIQEREQLANKTEHINEDVVQALVDFGHGSAFRRACMSMMAWSLTNEERAEVRDAFIEMDTDRTGTVTLAEFKSIVEGKFHISDEVAEDAFHSLDASHSEEIYYSEFLAAMLPSRIRFHDDLLKATFRRFDVNSCGFITGEDLTKVLGTTMSAAEIHRLIDEVDVSHDGKISYDEFIEYLRDCAEDHHMDAACRVIDVEVANSKKQPTLQQRTKRADPDKADKTAAADKASVKCSCVLL